MYMIYIYSLTSSHINDTSISITLQLAAFFGCQIEQYIQTSYDKNVCEPKTLKTLATFPAYHFSLYLAPLVVDT